MTADQISSGGEPSFGKFRSQQQLTPLILYGAVLVITGLFAIIIFNSYFPKETAVLKDVTVTSSVERQTKNITLPYSKDKGAAQEKLDFIFTLVYKQNEPTIFTIIPDDCVELLTINGKNVPLEGDVLQKRCDFQHGFDIDLKSYLHAGDNQIRLQILNLQGATGLAFNQTEN